MGETKQVVLPNSKEAIRHATLGSYAADLIEAADAFAVADSFSGKNNEPDATIYRFLVAHGVIAYARCFTNSKVRDGLGAVFPVPLDFIETHDSLLKYRNRTIAHSESELQQSFSVADITRVGTTVTLDRILSITISTGLPRSVVKRARDLIAAMQSLLQSEQEAAKLEVAASIDADGATALWSEGERLQLTPTDEIEWTADTRRSRYPKSHMVPIYIGADPSSETSLALSWGAGAWLWRLRRRLVGMILALGCDSGPSVVSGVRPGLFRSRVLAWRVGDTPTAVVFGRA